MPGAKRWMCVRRIRRDQLHELQPFTYQTHKYDGGLAAGLADKELSIYGNLE
jgi:hypothetical protein